MVLYLKIILFKLYLNKNQKLIVDFCEVTFEFLDFNNVITIFFIEKKLSKNVCSTIISTYL